MWFTFYLENGGGIDLMTSEFAPIDPHLDVKPARTKPLVRRTLRVGINRKLS